MKIVFNEKTKLVLTRLTIVLFFVIAFSSATVGMSNTVDKSRGDLMKEGKGIVDLGGLQSQDGDWDYWSSSPDMYAIPSGNVGIGTTSPSAKLDVEVRFNEGGAATIGSSYNVALGNYAVAMGYSTAASSNYSTAMGKYTTASGSTSTAMGWGTTASGSCSIAMGEDTTASGSFSTAMGQRITVNGDYSVGIGLNDTPYTVTDHHVLSVIGGNVGIGTTSPNYLLDVSGGSGLVAQFSGRVSGAEAVNDNEFVTKSQVDDLITDSDISHRYIPTGSDDPYGDVGDTAWDDYYFYVKTDQGWKRVALSTW